MGIMVYSYYGSCRIFAISHRVTEFWFWVRAWGVEIRVECRFQGYRV